MTSSVPAMIMTSVLPASMARMRITHQNGETGRPLPAKDDYAGQIGGQAAEVGRHKDGGQQDVHALLEPHGGGVLAADMAQLLLQAQDNGGDHDTDGNGRKHPAAEAFMAAALPANQ